MGDRTWVYITIQIGNYKNLLKKYPDFKDKVGYASMEGYENLIIIKGEEINYANWGELEELLKENKIEYDKSWGAGGEYSSGIAYGRIINGKFKILEITDDDMSLLAFLEKVLKLEPQDLLKEIKDEYKRLKHFEPTPLNEPNSLKFIKDSKK